MQALIDRVRRTIRRFGLITQGGRLIAALSGGGDSVAMVHLLRDIEQSGGFELVGLAHLNHMLRGAAADEDEAFCREMAARLGLLIEVERADVRQLALQTGRSLEDAARRARYSFLERVAAGADAERVAVGHTREDQAETVLLRLIRGAGPRGIAGIHPRAGRIVRPMLEVSRRELRDYLAEREIDFREDASNLDLAIPRNRIRREILPLLERHFSPAIVETLVRVAHISREDADFLEASSQAAESRVLSLRNGTVLVHVPSLLAEPPAIRRRILQRAMKAVSAGRFVGFDHVNRLMEFALDRNMCGPIDFPGHRAERIGENVVLVEWGGERARGALPRRFSYPLPVPSVVWLPEAGLEISAVRQELLGAEAKGGVLALASDSGRVGVVDAGLLSRSS
jgi:tRNA(Ile)-lysidine synthase